MQIDNDILIRKNEYYVNIKNRCHIINNDILITKTNCIKLKSMIRKNVMSLKNIKNNLYSVKKDTNSFSIDLKKLKEEYINNFNKRVKVWSIITNNKVNCFNRRFNHFINKKSWKINACTIKDSAIVKNHINACTSTDDLIAKNHVDACTSTGDLIVKTHVDACTSTDDLIVKTHVDACTSTDDVYTNENEPCTNENDDSGDDSDDDDSDNKRGNNGNNDNTKVQINKYNSKLKVNNTKLLAHNDKVKVDKVQVNNYNTKVQVNNDKSIIIKKNKVVDQFNLIAKTRPDYLKNVNEISEIMNYLPDDPQLRHKELNKINVLTDKSLDHASELSHGGNREWYGAINNIDTINDKIDLVNEVGEVIHSYMADAYNIVDVINKSHNNDLLYDISAEDLKKYKDTILKTINSSNVCAKQDTQKTDADNATVCAKQDTNNDKVDTNNNNKPDTKVKDKPDTKVKHKPDTKVKDKPDTKVKDKEDVESSASKN